MTVQQCDAVCDTWFVILVAYNSSKSHSNGARVSKRDAIVIHYVGGLCNHEYNGQMNKYPNVQPPSRWRAPTMSQQRHHDAAPVWQCSLRDFVCSKRGLRHSDAIITKPPDIGATRNKGCCRRADVCSQLAQADRLKAWRMTVLDLFRCDGVQRSGDLCGRMLGTDRLRRSTVASREIETTGFDPASQFLSYISRRA